MKHICILLIVTFSMELPAFLYSQTRTGTQGTVEGKVYLDIDQNRSFGPGDFPLSGWTVTATGNGAMELTTTDADGNYYFTLPSGDYLIVQTLQSGWMQTAPTAGTYWITISDTTADLQGLDFINWHQLAAISGYVFEDDNADGILDSGETSIRGKAVDLTKDSDPHWSQTLRTDESGHFSIELYDTGIYHLSLEVNAYNTQTFPTDGNGYTIDVNFLWDSIPPLTFGIFDRHHALSSISGVVYNDIDRNDVKGLGEPGISYVQMILDGDRQDESTTGHDGSYHFAGLPPGTYHVTAKVDTSRWLQNPPSYDYVLPVKTTITNANFAEKSNETGSFVIGTVFHDVNGNAVRDSGEPGIGFWTVRLTADEHNTALAVTDTNGNFVFHSLNPGTYVVSEELKSYWVQTYPKNFSPQTIWVGPESTVTHVDFGNRRDSAVSEGYRSFTAEDLSLTRDYKGVLKWTPIKKYYPTQVQFSGSFVNNDSKHRVATGLGIGFRLPLSDTLMILPAASQVSEGSGVVNITFSGGIPFGQSVEYSGFASELALGKGDQQKVNYATWQFVDGGTGLISSFSHPLRSAYSSYEMPNAVDVLMAMAGHPIQVGNITSRSVRLLKYGDIGKSLNFRNIIHMGTPKCLGYYRGNLIITRQQRSFPPMDSVISNKLFSETVALKVNVLASDLHITPPGFGDLIYNEGGPNPLNGMSVRSIVDVVDTYMSSNEYLGSSGRTSCHIPVGYEWLDSLRLWQTIRNIDSAFSAPIATNFWIPGAVPRISLTPVQSISKVLFLHLDATFDRAAAQRSLARDFVQIPERFELLQNYPNPFNPTTTIQFNLPQTAIVTIKIYDILGRELTTLLEHQPFDAGYQNVRFNASEFASGVYLYRMVAESVDDNGAQTGESFIQVKKMVLLK